MQFEQRVATPFSRTGQIYRSGLPPIRYALSYSAFRIKCSLMLLQQLSRDEHAAREEPREQLQPQARLSLLSLLSLLSDSQAFLYLDPTLSYFRIFSAPPASPMEFVSEIVKRSHRSPRQRNHCCALNNTLSLNYDSQALSHPATVLRRSNILPKTREPRTLSSFRRLNFPTQKSTREPRVSKRKSRR